MSVISNISLIQLVEPKKTEFEKQMTAIVLFKIHRHGKNLMDDGPSDKINLGSTFTKRTILHSSAKEQTMNNQRLAHVIFLSLASTRKALSKEK